MTREEQARVHAVVATYTAGSFIVADGFTWLRADCVYDGITAALNARPHNPLTCAKCEELNEEAVTAAEQRCADPDNCPRCADEPAAPAEAPSARDIAEQAIGLFLEYRDKHGKDEEDACTAACLEFVDAEGYVPNAHPPAELERAVVARALWIADAVNPAPPFDALEDWQREGLLNDADRLLAALAEARKR